MAKKNLSFSWEKLDLGKNIPEIRACHAMSYAGGSKVVLFGGYGCKEVNNDFVYELFNDTWEYDSKSRSWEKIKINGDIPKARKFHTMSYAGGSKIILFGGSESSELSSKIELKDTWEYDTSTQKWTQFNTSGPSPSARSNAVMSYAGGSKIILFGGFGGFDKNNKPIILDDTWEYDASTHVWAQHKTKASPSARFDHTMAYAEGSKILLAGGTNDIPRSTFSGHVSSNIFFNEIWEFDINEIKWTKLSNLEIPNLKYYFTIAYAGGSKVILLYSESSYIRETWEYDSLTNIWFKYTKSTKKPDDRDLHAMSYAGDSKVIIFGGSISHGAFNPDFNDTWELNIESDL